MIKVAVIILNYNGFLDTLACLKSVAATRRKGLKIQPVVVDYSKDSEEQRRIEREYPEITVLHKKGNLGFAGGNNTGMQWALDQNFDYVMLLNNDTIVDDDLFIHLVTFLEKRPKVGAVSPKIYFYKGHEFHVQRYTKEEQGRVIWYAGGKIDWDNIYASHRGVDQVDTGQFEKVWNTNFISGCCVLIRRSVLEEVGWLDENLFMYWEDTDWSLRVKSKGWQILYYPKAHLWHKNAGGSGVGSNLHNYFLTRNRLWFGFKYAPLRTKFALLRQSVVQLAKSDRWVKQGIKDYYLGKMGKGSWK